MFSVQVVGEVKTRWHGGLTMVPAFSLHGTYKRRWNGPQFLSFKIWVF